VVRHLASLRQRAGAGFREGMTAPLFGVRNDGQNDILIALDFEVEAPVPRYPALPHVERFAVFFRVQGGVSAVGEQEAQLLSERLADDDRQPGIVLVGSFREA
jgi:hypothetical protein